MRLARLLFSLLVLTAIGVLTVGSAAQDTNFPIGPQYLVTAGSTMFLHSIATPSLSLSAPPPSFSTPVAEALPEPSSPFSAPPQPDLTRIFWGEPATERTNEGASQAVSEIELTSTQPSQPLPPSILDTGVTGMTNAQSLRFWGFGSPLGDTASFWKAHSPHASRRYTNADVQRLHPS